MQCRRVNGPRVELKWPVFVFDADGMPCGLCKTMNVSAKGARLTMSEKFDIPDNFSLSFSPDRKVSRHCNVIWRDDNDLGIQFVTAPALVPASTPFMI